MLRPEVLLAVLLALPGMGQGPEWQAIVAPVDSAGYHAILLSPELVGLSAPDLRDLRLWDDAGREVPFLLQVEPRMKDDVLLQPFTLLRNEVLPGKATVVEIDAGAGTLLDALHLRINKARVSKPMRLTGSDDRTNWYMVRDARLDLGLSGSPGTDELRIVDLAPSRYRYYRLVLDDSLTAPVRILDVGHTARVRTMGDHVRIEAVEWHQNGPESGGRVFVTGSHPLVVEGMRYTVRGKDRYHRDGSILTERVMEERIGRRRKAVRTRTVQRKLASLTLTSFDGGWIDGLDVRADDLSIELENGDDSPLEFATLELWQLERRMIADLSPGMRYRITTGDPSLSKPRYDLQRFRDSLAVHAQHVGVEPVVPVRSAMKPDAKGLSQRWVWVAILLLIAAMGWSAVTILRKR